MLSTNSDHALVKLQISDFDGEKLFVKKWGHQFHFEEQWLEHGECLDIVREGWSGDFFQSAALTRVRLSS